MYVCSQKEDAESHTSLAPGVRSASSSDRRSLTRVLHVPPLPSASSAPAFPLGSPFDHSLIASTTPSLPSHQPSRALPGGLSRSFGASGSTAGGHNPVPAPNGTADSNTARQPTPSSTSQTGIQSALSTPSVPHAAPTSSMASAFTSAAASGLPPLSPVQPASSVPQQHPVGQLPVALALQASSSVEVQETTAALH